MEPCLLLSAQTYDFKDETGRRIEGVSLTYVTNEVQANATSRGCSPLKVSAPSSLWGDLLQVPGFYEMDFRQRPGPKGKPSLQVTGLRFIGGLSLKPVAEKAAP